MSIARIVSTAHASQYEEVIMTTHPAQLKVHPSKGERLRLWVAWHSFRHKALLLPLPQPKQALLWPVPHNTHRIIKRLSLPHTTREAFPHTLHSGCWHTEG